MPCATMWQTKQWLLTIVRLENASYFERRRLETVDIDNLMVPQSVLLAEAPTEELDELREAIFGLEDDYRELLVLQVLMGFSTKEIAEQVGLK
jgi:RNA polymerase sigma-70 factor (ECF subfamily)